MQDKWYSDKCDLVKWGVLVRLAERFRAKRVLQVAYYRPTVFGELLLEGAAIGMPEVCGVPEAVLGHFRNMRNITSLNCGVRITVFDQLFEDRGAYQQAVLALLADLAQERLIVFLDPDTGLAPPGNMALEYVLDSEVRGIWDAMKHGDVLAVYQHRTPEDGELEWSGMKRQQLAQALGVETPAAVLARGPAAPDDLDRALHRVAEFVKLASGPDITPDVVLFYCEKG